MVKDTILISELKIIGHKIPKEFTKSIEVLQFIIDLQNPFPNAFLEHILSTTPINVAIVELFFQTEANFTIFTYIYRLNND